jgi:hypothetical protein
LQTRGEKWRFLVFLKLYVSARQWLLKYHRLGNRPANAHLRSRKKIFTEGRKPQTALAVSEKTPDRKRLTNQVQKTIRLKKLPCIRAGFRYARMKYGCFSPIFVTRSNPIEEKRSNIAGGVASSSGA